MRKVELRESPIEGLGIFAVVPIREGEPIWVSDGTAVDGGEDQGPTHVVMTDDDFQAYIKTVDRWSSVDIRDGLHRVTLKLSEVDYVNRSCDPNVWGDGAQNPVLVARRDIAPGDELTTDYAACTDGEGPFVDCRCGSTLCRGTLMRDDWKLPSLQARYAGHWPTFLERRIRAAKAIMRGTAE